jgi:hypothetical protein
VLVILTLHSKRIPEYYSVSTTLSAEFKPAILMSGPLSNWPTPSRQACRRFNHHYGRDICIYNNRGIFIEGSLFTGCAKRQCNPSPIYESKACEAEYLEKRSFLNFNSTAAIRLAKSFMPFCKRWMSSTTDLSPIHEAEHQDSLCWERIEKRIGWGMVALWRPNDESWAFSTSDSASLG